MVDISNIKIGIIVPDRGDRPLFRKHCEYLISKQTVQPTQVVWVDFMPISNEVDITKRYRIGYNYISELVDVILFMENDDWYSPNYIETMLRAWITAGKPDIFGTDYTHYYHIKLKKWFTMNHNVRSSAMSTLIKPNLNIDWCPDNEPYTDTYLWMMAINKDTGKPLTKAVFHPEPPICLGMKHGVGLTGGNSHVNRLHRYINDDVEQNWLRSIVDEQSFEFYKNYFTN